MNAEFNWWLLIVGLVVGAGLVWLVLADWSRREEDVAADELSAESAWIAQALRDRGEDVDPATAEEILALHRAYLRDTGALDSPEPADEDADGADTMDDEAGWPPDATSDDTPDAATHERAPHAPTREPAAAREAAALEWPDAPTGGPGPRTRTAATPEVPREHHSVRETPLAPRGGPSPDPDVRLDAPRP